MIEELFREWVENVDDVQIKAELASMCSDVALKDDCFYKHLAFGTGGVRGLMGAGINRMNKYTIGRVTFGLADYLNNTGTVAIAYDTRNHSREFAFCIADILSSRGIEVYIYDCPVPTPMLSFTVRFLKADAGIVVTASHNPKEYNGYKVYNKHGCQITDEVAKEITSCIEKHGCFEKYSANANKIHLLEEEMEDSFLDAVLRCGVGVKREYPSFVYTPFL